ncbi:glycosyltransferase family 4 protein [Lacisediminimonas sp.]|uniref:glycosyltransferase family 4 protein n=1 Tax=Lacisediminimonas sp. TaxID=3060582 RepID=UPI002722C072|nr:glycosyltransferase family 4 protein [Lacisediminimonas sp.]MDO8298696.1 glycosyltransferase family 4 protein [Lacisediminimonas sp.]
MKLLVITQYFWPENFLINDLVRELGDRGIEVVVLTGKPNYPEGRIADGYRSLRIQREMFGKAEVVRLPIVPRGRDSRLGLALNYLSFVVSGALLGPLAMRGRDFDLVFVYAPSPLLQALPAILMKRLKRTPLIVWVQDLWPESLSATGHVQAKWILHAVSIVVRFIYRSSSRVLIQSEAFRGPVAALTDRTEKIHYYPNLFVEPTNLNKPTERALALAAELRRSFSVVFAGNLGTAQSLETVLDAAEFLRGYGNIRLWLVGSGSRDHWLAAEIDRRGLENVVVAGRFPATDMPVVLGAASALLVTLRAEPIFGYTIPSKIQAYLAAGRPIIAAIDGEGARVVVDAGAGISCPAGNARMLAESIVLLNAKSADELRGFGERGREYFLSHFSPAKLVDQLIEHFDQAVADVKGEY